jgi:spermidine/putrescine-binding protein
MKRLAIVLLTLALAGPVALAQNFILQKTSQPAPAPAAEGGDDVFVPISKYIAAGNAEALSAWFADNLEIAVLAKESDASRAQARQIVKTFFDNFTPRSFNVTHTAGRANMKYALGTLKAGGETFNVTIFLSCKEDRYRIQQLKIERL